MTGGIVVHIGQHKTGSSSIQRTLFEQRDRLAGQGAYYFGGRENHGVILGLFRDRPKQGDVLDRKGYHDVAQRRALMGRLRSELSDWLASHRTGVRLLSGEALCDLDRDEVIAFHRYLSAHAENIRILAYVREPFSYASSMAQQELRSGSTFAQLCAESLARDSAERPYSVHPNYRAKLEHYREVFGADRVVIRKFDPGDFLHGDVTEDFLQTALGRSSAQLGIARLRTNESLDQSAAEFLEARNRAARERAPRTERVRNSRIFLSTLGRVERRVPFRLRDFDYARFAELVRPDVEWLAEATGGRIRFGLGPECWPAAPAPADPDALALSMEQRLGEYEALRPEHVLVRSTLALLLDSECAGDRFSHALPKVGNTRLLFQIARLLARHGAADLARAALARSLAVAEGDEEARQRVQRLARELRLDPESASTTPIGEVCQMPQVGD